MTNRHIWHPSLHLEQNLTGNTAAVEMQTQKINKISLHRSCNEWASTGQCWRKRALLIGWIKSQLKYFSHILLVKVGLRMATSPLSRGHVQTSGIGTEVSHWQVHKCATAWQPNIELDSSNDYWRHLVYLRPSHISDFLLCINLSVHPSVCV